MEEKTALLESMYFYNSWWRTGAIPESLALPFERECLSRLTAYLSANRVIVIKGPRRTGKTTLVYQIIKSLLKDGIPPSNILYLSFDEIATRSSLDEIVAAYEKIVRKTVSEFKDVYFFLDEVHFLNNWSNSVKKYFDTKSHIKFIVSGSSASLLKKGTESLAGRTIEEIILPLNFREYLLYHTNDKKLAALIASAKGKIADAADFTPYIPYKSKIGIVFNDYLTRGGFPHLLEIKDETVLRKVMREDVVEKVIYRDLVDLFGIKKPAVLEKLFLYLVDISAGILNTSHIASSLGLSREYTEKYIEYLKSAYLVFTLPRYARSAESQLRAAAKVFVIDTGLSGAFAPHKDKGHLVETLVAGHLFGRKLYYWKDNYEVDFIIADDAKIIPLEVKYKDNIDTDDLNGLLSFMDKFRVKKGVIFTKDSTREIKIKGKKIVCKPVWLGLLEMRG